jgi:hypothetical protein
MNNTHTDSLSFEQIIDSHLTFITHLITQAQQAETPTTQHLTLLISLQNHDQTHIDHLFDSLNTLTLHQRDILTIIPTTPLPPPSFLPLDDILVDAVAYIPPPSVEALSLSSSNSSPRQSPRQYPNAPPGHHTASQENPTSPLSKRFKFYAIRFGRTNIIICRSWTECAPHILGYPNAQYKSFTTHAEALAYLRGVTSTYPGR